VSLATLTPGALEEARERTLNLLAPLSDADVETAHSALMSPLVWDLAHIAAYEDLWLVHRHGGEPLLHPELAAMYDAFETPRAVRGDLALLDRGEALAYLAEVRERALEVLARTGPAEVHEMVLQHEQQHNETMLQAIELAQLGTAPGLHAVPPREATARHTGLEAIEVSGGPFLLGAPTASPGGSSPASPRRFSFDNERPRHVVDMRPFLIGRTPVTNATFLTFAEGGGYQRREWWSDEGWSWKEDYDITHPGGWAAGPDGWRQWRLDGWAPLHPDEPVVHVSWFEADAFARSLGARLPTEQEWEKAAAWDQERGRSLPYPWGEHPAVPGDGRANLDQTGLGPQPAGSLPAGAAPSGALGMLGDTWEWTSTAFHGYPGFSAHPYREYSEVFFGADHRVLRGGSWATRSNVATTTFRNWDLPQRRQIFSGLRLAWDAP
jgi:gamma-glutamyl hercynylcysteine S-oxide synthase